MTPKHKTGLRSLLLGVGTLAVAMLWGCSGARHTVPGTSVCERYDSLYSASGFESPVRLSGKAIIDASDHRFRGKVVLDVQPSGDFVFEFASSILFGSEREDFVFSVIGDTLRLFDRERGLFYEGEDVEEYLGEALDMDFDIQGGLRRAVGGRPPCGSLDHVELNISGNGEMTFTGKTEGEPFRVVFASEHQRLREVEWPVWTGNGLDRLRVTYDWVADDQAKWRVRQMTMRLDKRQWRCKISS